MVREIRRAKINPKSSFKNLGAQITRANTVFGLEGDEVPGKWGKSRSAGAHNL